MASLRKRIENLESLLPSGIQHLRDEELDTRISELCNKPEIHNWLTDDIDEDPLRLRVNGLMALK